MPYDRHPVFVLPVRGYAAPVSDHDREKRRSKRLQKQKKKRANASRPARVVGGKSGPGHSVAIGAEWPPGDCFANLNWDEPGTVVHLVVSRTHEDGRAVLGWFTIDRSGLGLVDAGVRGGLRAEHVAGHVGRTSEETSMEFVQISPAIAASLVHDALEHGTAPATASSSEARRLLKDLPLVDLGVPFGAAVPEPSPPPTDGWISGIRRWWSGT